MELIIPSLRYVLKLVTHDNVLHPTLIDCLTHNHVYTIMNLDEYVSTYIRMNVY